MLNYYYIFLCSDVQFHQFSFLDYKKSMSNFHLNCFQCLKFMYKLKARNIRNIYKITNFVTFQEKSP